MKNINICIIGLGYVGLPLAIQLSKYYSVTGFDIDNERISSLSIGFDKNYEFSKKDLLRKKLSYANNFEKEVSGNCNIYIITVPTPVNKKFKPDLKYLRQAFSRVAKVIKKNNILIVESTVAPGTVEQLSIKFFKEKHKDINLCFCPERINPGDRVHTINKITKVISSNTDYGKRICKLIYSKTTKSIFAADNIKTAEMAKIIENTQRDVNIALMNEFSKICKKLNIETRAVLDACNTKWNSLNFYPGLVGGHCVPVDPYYLIDKCKSLGVASKIISESRATNEQYVYFIKDQILKILKSIKVKKKILFCGLAFKNNVVDIRNSKNLELFKILEKTYNISVYDDYKKYPETLIKDIKFDNLSNIRNFNVIIISSINQFVKLNKNQILKFLSISKNNIVIDLTNYYSINSAKNNRFFRL